MTLIADVWKLDLNLGAVGWGTRHAFAVRLDARRLQALLAGAASGSRTYELLALQRPGDLWAYVDVQSIQLPPALHGAWSEATRYQHEDDQRMSFEAFDLLFQWMGDDTPPESEAWLGRRPSADRLAFLGELHRIALEAVAELPQDELTTHVRQLVREGRHGYDGWPRTRLVRNGRRSRPPQPPLLPPAFYDTAARLLALPDVEAVAYRGEGDHQLMRMMCNEQRRRANLRSCKPGEALHLSALADLHIDNTDWDSELWLYDEGIGWGDLWIEGAVSHGAPLAELLGTPFQKFGRWVLSQQDLGELPGYAHTANAAWHLYEARPGTPIPRPPRPRG